MTNERALGSTTAEHLRVALARRVPRPRLYRVAAFAHLHPVTLSAILNERKPLTRDLADRILRAIAEV